MSHVDLKTLGDFAGSRRVPRRDLGHLNRCVTCRRAAAEHGISNDRIASAIAAGRPWPRVLFTAVVLTVLVGAAVVMTPLRGAASGFLTFFEPHTVVAIPMTLEEMRSLGRMPDLAAYATTRELRASTWANFTNPDAAAGAARFALRQPANVPSGMRAVSYLVQGPSAQLIRFGTHAPAAGTHALPPLPPDIVGGTLQIDLGATVVATYETAATAVDSQRLQRAMLGLQPPVKSSSIRVSASAVTAGRPPQPMVIAHGGSVTKVWASGDAVVQPRALRWGFSNRGGSMPLVVVQMPVPRVASSGVSIARLTSFMLEQPGIPPRLVAAFRALGDPMTTLPIPVPIEKAYTQPVFVDGVQGVGVGDDTGIGAAVIWQKNGMLYAVFATQTARNVLAIANSLR